LINLLTIIKVVKNLYKRRKLIPTNIVIRYKQAYLG